MKIKFTKLPSTTGIIQVSFDGGKKFTEYNVEEVSKSGIILSDTQDFSLIQIKSESTILTNLDVIKHIKLVGQKGTSSGSLNNYFILDNSMTRLNVLSPGIILPYGGTVAPIGWHLCDGSTDEREDYPRLIAWAIENDVIGSGKLLGAGDGSTTFTFPDARECVLVGAGQSSRSEIADHDVYSVGQFKDDQMQSHTHSGGRARGDYAHNSRNTNIGSAGRYATDGSSDYQSGRRGTTTHGKQFGINFIIKCY
jgi:microcystin-dependent protein